MTEANDGYEVEYEQPRWRLPAPRRRAWRPPLPRPGQRRVALITAVVIALVAITAGLSWYRVAHRSITVTAWFTQSIGVYPGSDVRILGVQVGRVLSEEPEGTRVKVIFSVDANVPVPASAQAVVVTNGVVGDRYIQLTPAYTSGRRMRGGAVIPVSRTAVPLEVDQIYASLSKFFKALGPAGVNKKGALSSLIKTGAATLGGNGKNLNNMITQFSALNRTLGGSSADFFATVANLDVFNTALAKNDAQVKLAEQQLASVTGYLAADRQNLGAALSELATALAQVRAFIADNRSAISSNVTKLASITRLLVTERDSLAEALSVAPLAVDNILNAYDNANRSLVGRDDLNELSLGPAAKIFGSADALPASVLPVGSSALTALPPLPLPAVGTVYGTPVRGSR
jgi:phospholipid/cholesterol/gamma-HCH transport system substrate-binding protein